MHEDLADDEELRQMKQELDLLANDPDLATDLKQLKRETKNVGTTIQTELMPSFYDIDTVCQMIGDRYLIVKRQDTSTKQDLQDLPQPDTPVPEREVVNGGSIVSAMQRSKIDAYYKAVAANQTLAHARPAADMYLKGHPYSNYHPLAGASVTDHRASSDILVQ